MLNERLGGNDFEDVCVKGKANRRANRRQANRKKKKAESLWKEVESAIRQALVTDEFGEGDAVDFAHG